MPSLDPSFRPLEYWKPPKAVRHHIRAKSSAIFSAGGNRHSFSHISEKEEKSFTTTAKIPEMSSWPTNQYSEGVNMASRGAAPAYRIDDEDTLKPRWYDVREWRKKIWIGLGVAVAIIIIVVVVAVVEVERANRYPDYSPLSYSLAETCMYIVSSTTSILTVERLWYYFLRPVRLFHRIRSIPRIRSLRPFPTSRVLESHIRWRLLRCSPR